MKTRHSTALEEALGHRFHRPELLQQALTHASHAREAESQNAGSQVADYEPLEFLGDAVLGFVVSRELFERFPSYREGELSKLRAHLVSGQHLVRVARDLGVGDYLHLSRGEEKSGGRAKAALLVDSLEAVLAALYLDAGLDRARNFIVQAILEPELQRLGEEGAASFAVTDFKSALQERVHTTGYSAPAYVLVKEDGPEHRKTFTVETRLQRRSGGEAEFVARATGSTKKRAEQDAARLALEYLRRMDSEETVPEREPVKHD